MSSRILFVVTTAVKGAFQMTEQERNEWVLSAFLTGPQPGYCTQTAVGKFSGGQYQYEITLQGDGKWRLFPKSTASEPIYGATPKDCLDQLKTAGIE
jgi:hypothetical protein